MFLLRHAQSLFNLHFNETRKDPGIADPELTPFGTEQAAEAARRLLPLQLTRIIVSPYTRTLQTAAPILHSRAAAVEIMPEVRERAAFSCDIGSAADVLAQRFPLHDFSRLPQQWWPDRKESEQETVARAAAFRARMASRPDQATTLLVSHWAFLLALSGISLDNAELLEYDPCTRAPDRLEWF